MALIGAISWFRCLILCIAQFLATIAASYIVYSLFNGGLNVNPGLHGGTSKAQGVVIEMLLTAQVMFTIFMLAVEEHAATPLAPIGIGLSVFIAHLVGKVKSSTLARSQLTQFGQDSSGLAQLSIQLVFSDLVS
jgi:aquaporin related protein